MISELCMKHLIRRTLSISTINSKILEKIQFRKNRNKKIRFSKNLPQSIIIKIEREN